MGHSKWAGLWIVDTFIMGRITLLLILLSSLLWTACEQQTSRRTDYTVHGIDVSHYQSFIEWDSVAESGIHFAFLKATEGESLKDTLYDLNWQATRRAGIKRGAYHFFRPTVPAEEQALHFFRQVQLTFGDLPPVLDVEVLDGATKMDLIVGIKTWLWMAEIHYGLKPILYTNMTFYNRYLAGHFNEYPLWIARYNTFKPNTACGRSWQFWQYGNQGQIGGITGDVDFNVFHGSAQELEALCLQRALVANDDRQIARIPSAPDSPPLTLGE